MVRTVPFSRITLEDGKGGAPARGSPYKTGSIFRVKRTLVLFCVLAAVATGGAQAITYGQPDGNGHPSTGAMVYFSPSRQAYRIICSGSLISPTVFLTASHCTSFLEENGISDVWVTFDSQFSQSSTLYHGAMHTNPLYNNTSSDPGDIAVITLDNPINSITPVQLPAAGLLDLMKKAGTLNGTNFTSVGYGDQEASNGPGGHVFPFTGERRVASGEFNALTNAWLKVSQNNSHGDGGTCYGDSGGPQFLGSSNLQVSLTVTGDTYCKSTNVDYRIDTPQARAFLDDYVTLP
jgi:secreted trypsin-like serine protease